MTPYVGQVVHYRYHPHDEPAPAIVTKVHDDTWVGLFIMGPGATRFATHVEKDVGWKEIEHKEPTPWGGMGGV